MRTTLRPCILFSVLDLRAVAENEGDLADSVEKHSFSVKKPVFFGGGKFVHLTLIYNQIGQTKEIIQKKGSDNMKKLLTVLLLLCMVVTVIPVSAAEGETTPTVEIGTYISLGKYKGKSIIWRCVDIDENGPLMLADRIVDTLPYDARTNDNDRSKSHSRNYKRDSYGSNYWKDSNMRSWLNSTAVAGEVKWLCGNPPKSNSVKGNSYDDKAGFLNEFSKVEIAAVKTVTQRSLVSHPEYKQGIYEGDARSDLELNYDIENVAGNFDSAYYENSTEKVFLLDVKQVNNIWKKHGSYYIAANDQGTKWPYWLRTPVSDCNHDMRYVQSDGTVGRESPDVSYIGVRPAFYLDADYYVTTGGDGTAANPYIGSAPDKIENDYTVAEPEDDPNQDWDIDVENSLKLNLGPYYSKDGKYAEPIIPVYTIQKTRSDTENMVIIICGEGYTKSQQQKFIGDAKRVWSGAMQYEPYRSYADRFNVYALCTASESSFENDGSTFFDVVVGSNNSSSISGNINGNVWKNHIFERCIGPEFIEKIHDAHIPNKTEPNTYHWNDDEQYPPYYYVHNYISQFALLVNTSRNFGDAYTNLKFGFHYFITPSDSYRAPQTFAHELGHGLLGLGDEYMDSVTEQSDLTSLNVAYTHDPEKVKWKQLLGFRKTYTCPSTYTQKAYNSGFECLMRDTDYSFCEVCRLQGYKRLSQLVEGKNLYVAAPEVKEYTGQYSSLSDFKDTSYYGYNKFSSYRSGVLLSGSSKNRFGNSMAGKQIELRTIVQNLSDTTERSITMKLWISRADGSVAATTDGSKLEAAETFLIPVWSEKSNFWPKGALDYTGSNFNSGLLSCSMIYQIPSDVTLKDGDYVAFEVTDEKGNVLANDNTENQTYANVTIQYCLEDGSQIPNTNSAEIPVPVGTKFDGSTHPVPLYGYTFVRADGLDQTVTSKGLNVTYYYAKQAEEHTHNWGKWESNGNGTHTCTCMTDNSHSKTADCVGGEATCTNKAVCEICLAAYGEINTSNHDYGEPVVTHSTCTTAGSKIYVCERNSSHSYSEALAIDADAHTWGEWTIETPASCVDTGQKVRTCINNEEHKETVEIPKNEHTYTAVKTAPTCTEKGYTTYTCECGTGYVGDYVEATGHTDANNDGICDACEKTLNKNCSDICHSESALAKFFYRVLLFFWKLFKINKTCSCGIAHY